jgi:3-hydroxymyristoyl/3-hydroxydecanoyl-(acyl carrier protein) dehydratase
MSWLSSLPHQIPFRAASALIRRDEKTIEGTFLWTANETLPAELMLLEAMAQFAGGVAFAHRAGHGLLVGVDYCEIKTAITAGDVVHIMVAKDAEFGGMHRFTGNGRIGELECVRARFYLAEPPPANA